MSLPLGAQLSHTTKVCNLCSSWSGLPVTCLLAPHLISASSEAVDPSELCPHPPPFWASSLALQWEWREVGGCRVRPLLSAWYAAYLSYHVGLSTLPWPLSRAETATRLLLTVLNKQGVGKRLIFYVLLRLLDMPFKGVSEHISHHFPSSQFPSMASSSHDAPGQEVAANSFTSNALQLPDSNLNITYRFLAKPK